MKHFYIKALMAGAIAIASFTSAQAETTTYYEDSFDWIASATTVAQGWDTTNEGSWRIDKWESNSVSNPGWMSFTGWVWARPGFVKLSKTGYNGDIVSPAISKIEGTTTVEASFQAVGYTSAKFKKDYDMFYVVALGAGKVTGVTGTGAQLGTVSYVDAATGDLSSLVSYSAAAVKIDTTAFMDPNETTALEVWKSDATKFTVTVEGATSATRIAFVAGGKIQSAKLDATDEAYLARVFIDNFKVTSSSSAVTDVAAAKQVAAVTYYNLAGQQSAEPFEGVNVVRTTFTDGTTSVAKMVK